MTPPGLQSPTTHYSTNTRALILGAGVAGCSIARALSQQGFNCVVYDELPVPAAATSAVPQALLRPQVTKTPQVTNYYFRHAFDRAQQAIAEAQAQIDEPGKIGDLGGVLQLVNDAGSWPHSAVYSRLDQSAASSLAGTELAADALYFEQAGRVNLSTLCQYWLSGLAANSPEHANGQIQFNGGIRVDSLSQTDNGWCLLDRVGSAIDESQLVVIANGALAGRLQQTAHLPLQRGRGQISFFTAPTDVLPNNVITGKGSIIATDDGFWAGSTHQRDATDTTTNAADDARNLATAAALCPHLTNSVRSEATKAWAGIRYSSPDRLPIVGAAPVHDWYQNAYADLRHGRRGQSFPHPRFHDGLYLLTGFGSRGAIHSVYAAELLAALIAGDTPAPGDDANAILHPGRFLIRQARRGRHTS